MATPSKYLLYSLLTVVLFFNSAIQLNGPNRLFEDEKKNISLELPSEWKLVTHREAESLQMFITLEAHIFTVGVTVTKKTGMSTIYSVKNEKDIIYLWTNGLDRAAESYNRYEILESKKFSRGKYTGIIREVVMQYQTEHNPVHMYQVIMAKDDELIYITAISPENVWEEYKPVFDNSLKSLTLK